MMRITCKLALSVSAPRALRLLPICLVFCFSAFSALPSQAVPSQTEAQNTPREQLRPLPWGGNSLGIFTTSSSLRARHTFNQDLNGNGSVSFSRAGLEEDLRYGITDSLTLTAGLGYENSQYTFSQLESLLPGRPALLTSGNLFSFSPGFVAKLGEDSAIVGNGLFRAGMELDASFSDSAQFGALLLYRFQLNPTLGLSVGALAIPQLEDTPIVVPALGVEWRPTPDYRLEWRGPSILGAKRLDDQWELYSRVSFEARDFRLSEEFQGQIVRDRGVPLEFGMNYSPLPFVTIGGNLGILLYQDFQLDDERGDQLWDSQQDPAPFFGVNLRVRL